jgi:hypothetical protein
VYPKVAETPRFAARLPELVIVKVWDTVVLRATVPNAIELLDTDNTAPSPVPERVTAWEATPSSTRIEPVAEPIAAGENVTLTVQELPAAMFVQLCVAAKALFNDDTPVTVIGTLPVLRTLTP